MLFTTILYSTFPIFPVNNQRRAMGIPGGEGSHPWISNLEALQKLARRQQGSCGWVKGIKIQLLNKMCVEINSVVMRNLEGRHRDSGSKLRR